MAFVERIRKAGIANDIAEAMGIEIIHVANVLFITPRCGCGLLKIFNDRIHVYNLTEVFDADS